MRARGNVNFAIYSLAIWRVWWCRLFNCLFYCWTVQQNGHSVDTHIIFERPTCTIGIARASSFRIGAFRNIGSPLGTTCTRSRCDVFFNKIKNMYFVFECVRATKLIIEFKWDGIYCAPIMTIISIAPPPPPPSLKCTKHSNTKGLGSTGERDANKRQKTNYAQFVRMSTTTIQCKNNERNYEKSAVKLHSMWKWWNKFSSCRWVVRRSVWAARFAGYQRAAEPSRPTKLSPHNVS